MTDISDTEQQFPTYQPCPSYAKDPDCGDECMCAEVERSAARARARIVAIIEKQPGGWDMISKKWLLAAIRKATHE